MFEDSYITIEAPAAGLFSNRGSRFISLAAPVRTENDVKEMLQKVRSDHPKANHHCYAFRLGPSKSVFRYSDDREPSGTAGKPIYGVIQANDLTDIIIVVSRIFGGTLLGVPGLIYAYREAARSAIVNAKIITAFIMEKYRLRFEYAIQFGIMDLIKQTGARILKRQESDECILEIELSKPDAGLLLEKIRNNYLLKENCEIKVI